MANIQRATTDDVINNLVINPEVGDIVETLGYSSKGDGGGAEWRFTGVTGQTPSQSPVDLGDALLNDASGNQWGIVPSSNVSSLGSDSPVINVPGRFSDIQEAINFLTSMSHNQEQSVEIILSSGFEIETPILINNVNASFITLSSIDAEVNVGSGYSGGFIIGVYNARSITLNTIININGNNSGIAFNVDATSTAVINTGCGMRNGVSRGLHATNASTVYADGSVFTGFQQAGIHCSRNSLVQCADADLSGNSQDPTNTFGALYASRGSTIHGPNINATSSGGDGVRAQRQATIICPDIDVSDCQGAAFVANSADIISTSGSPVMNNLKGQAGVVLPGGQLIIGAVEITFQAGMTDEAFEVRSGRLIIESVNFSGHEGRGIYAEGSNAIVDFQSGEVTGGTDGIFAQDGARITADSASISNCLNNGVTSSAGSNVVLRNASVTGSVNNDIVINNGGYISASGCTTTNGIGTPSLSDTNLTGGFNFANNGNRGLVWA